jgi:hypothetical protein
METTDPIAALGSKSIADRAAGCRDLSSVGTVENISDIAVLAGSDKSPGVRLSAAAAVADILSRCRVGDARKQLDDDQRDVFVAMFSRIDPALNAGVFPMIATLDRPRSLSIIAGGLRDPRGDLRLGAAVGLMRLCSSQAVAGLRSLEDSVVTLLSDARHQSDATAQIARVCAAVGYTSATETIRQLQLTGVHQDMVIDALGVLDGGQHALLGLWWSDGRDAGETNPNPSLAPGLMVFDGTGALAHDGKRWAVAGNFVPARRMFIRRSGEESARPAFQTMDRTFFSGVSPCFQHDDWSVQGRETKASVRAVAAVSLEVSGSAEDQYALAQVAMDAGVVGVARSALEASIGAKKTPAQSWLCLADLLWASKKKAARSHYETYIVKAKRRDNQAGMDRAKERV